ncbi:hypothetical protein [Halocalculus aciditolerans]|uniref:Uncharacterized protein n=1 Tax=Halocalculus aciditolerans TaxID=1383812 RepID=A0A830FGY5_9EURY|nr:hypothetical protein [Halocalculus aciditolerans]GGL73343.1 hypothetical protein GCM10009039_34340 [Halocalculus aciditolerans]
MSGMTAAVEWVLHMAESSFGVHLKQIGVVALLLVLVFEGRHVKTAGGAVASATSSVGWTLVLLAVMVGLGWTSLNPDTIMTDVSGFASLAYDYLTTQL